MHVLLQVYQLALDIIGSTLNAISVYHFGRRRVRQILDICEIILCYHKHIVHAHGGARNTMSP